MTYNNDKHLNFYSFRDWKPEMRVSLLVTTLFLLQTADFLYSHMAERGQESPLGQLLLGQTIHKSSVLMTYLPKTTLPNTISVGVNIPIYEF